MTIWLPYLLALGSIALSSAAQICLKLAMRTRPSLWTALHQPMLYGGLAAYGLSAVLWLLVLRRLPLTQAYPLVSLNFVLVLLGSAWLLHERATWTMGLGVLCIFAGLMLFAVGRPS